MDGAQLAKAFAATVQASLHELENLEATLHAEQQALLGRDPQCVEQAAMDKLAALRQLEHSIRARDRLQQAAGFDAGTGGGGRLVQQIDDAVLSDQWHRVTVLGGRVSELNNRNGQLVLQCQRATRSALEILTGRSATDDTYATLRHRKQRAAASYSLGKA